MTELMVPSVSVYLSGHMHYEEHDWRVKVYEALKDEQVHWLIPISGPWDTESKAHSALYVPRDKLSIQQADVVFIFLEDVARNIGTTWEAGYADGLGKVTLLVNKCNDIRSYDFPEQAADAVFRTLEEGIEALRFVVTAKSDSGMECKRHAR